MALHIVLFEPEIPQNTGNIARTCAAIGATLHLVHPLGFKVDEKSVRRAGLDYWKDVEVIQHKSVSSFLETHSSSNLWFFTTKSEIIYTDAQFERDSYIIFGKESKGIAESILVDYPTRSIRIPMIDETRSLNLSNSVAIGAYEWQRQHNFRHLNTKGALHRLSWNKGEN